MAASRTRQRRTWRLSWVLLACLPLLAQAQALSGLRVLPNVDEEHRFPGWQSEGAVPSTLAVPLELGDDVAGATLQLQPARTGGTWRVRVQYETSLGLGAEGPHLDLTGWKHCVSEWTTADAVDPVSFVLPVPSPDQRECFPEYTQAELEAAIRAEAAATGDPSQAARWLEGLRTPSAATPVTPFVAVSAVRVKVEVRRKDRWVEVTTVTFVPPMGC